MNGPPSSSGSNADELPAPFGLDRPWTNSTVSTLTHLGSGQIPANFPRPGDSPPTQQESGAARPPRPRTVLFAERRTSSEVRRTTLVRERHEAGRRPRLQFGNVTIERPCASDNPTAFGLLRNKARTSNHLQVVRISRWVWQWSPSGYRELRTGSVRQTGGTA